MTHTYGYGTDGMFYHASQVTVDANGRWVPRPGAHPGQIAKPTEFGEMPEIPEAAAAMLKAWNAGQPAAEAEDAEPSPATYDTKVVTPAAPAPTYSTKADAEDDDATRSRRRTGA